MAAAGGHWKAGYFIPSAAGQARRYLKTANAELAHARERLSEYESRVKTLESELRRARRDTKSPDALTYLTAQTRAREIRSELDRAKELRDFYRVSIQGIEAQIADSREYLASR